MIVFFISYATSLFFPIDLSAVIGVSALLAGVGLLFNHKKNEI